MGIQKRARSPEDATRRLMQRQFGCIHRDQALALGLSRRQIAGRLGDGRWSLLRPSVYRLMGTPSSWEQRVFSAVAWAGAPAAASHMTAARQWRLDVPPIEEIHVSIDGAWRRPPRDVVLHRTSWHFLRHTINVDGIRVTSMARTVFDVIAAGGGHGESLLDQAIRRRANFVGQMWLLLDEPWTCGRRGVAAVRDALRQRTDVRDSPQMDLADVLLRILRRERLPIPVAEFPIELPSGSIHVDLAYPLLRLAIECDGYASHMDRTSFDRDRARDAELMARGWRVLRFTWAQITYRQGWVLEQIRGRLSD